MAGPNPQYEIPADLGQIDHRTCLLPAGDGIVIFDIETPSGWIGADLVVRLADWR